MPEPIRWRDTQIATVPQSANATSFPVSQPVGTAVNDVLVAVVALGRTANVALPVFTAPPGWTLVRRVNHTTSSSLLAYVHVASAAEPPQYTWSSDLPVEGFVLVSAYSGVDNVSAVDASFAVEGPPDATQYSMPAITTTVPRAMVVGAIAGHAASATVWTTPSGMSARVNVSQTTRSAFFADRLEPVAGVAGPFATTAGVPQDYALTASIALRPRN